MLSRVLGKASHGIQKTMGKKAILLLGGNDLLSRSIEQMLSEKTDWEVMFVLTDQLPENVNSILEKLSPDVVVTQKGNNPRTSKALSVLFHSNPKLRLITITSDSNVMEIYNKEDVLMQSADDFFSAIEA